MVSKQNGEKAEGLLKAPIDGGFGIIKKTFKN